MTDKELENWWFSWCDFCSFLDAKNLYYIEWCSNCLNSRKNAIPLSEIL